MTEKEIKIQATKNGITVESIGEWMALAVRYLRRDLRDDAAECAAKALSIHAEYGRHYDGFKMTEGTLDRCFQIIKLAS